MHMDKKGAIVSEKDLMILKQLFEDGRKSSASISKEIDLGREIVNYRIKRLIKENLIVKFVPKLNEHALHYHEYIILLKLKLADEVSKEEFVRETIGNKYLIFFIKFGSGWDVLVRLYAQSVEEFKTKLSEILTGFSDVLANYYTIVSSEEIKQGEQERVLEELFKEKIISKDHEVIKREALIHLDQKDQQILSLLEADARIQYTEIAEQLNISSDTVKYRIDRMQKQGIIEHFIPVLNLTKIGLLQFTVIFKCTYLGKNEEKELISYINSKKQIIKAIKSLDSKEFFLIFACKEHDELEDFLSQLKSDIKERLETLEYFEMG